LHDTSTLVLVLRFWDWLTRVVPNNVQKAVKWLLLLLLIHEGPMINRRLEMF